MRRGSRILALGALLGALTAVGHGWAQDRESGFALNRFEPSSSGSAWFAGDSLDFRGDQRFAAKAVLDWAYKPLVTYDGDGDERTAVMRHQAFTHLG